MATSRKRQTVRVPQGLGARLLDELSRHGSTNPAMAPPIAPIAPISPDAAVPPSADQFASMYRSAIEQLEAQVAQRDGHPPMRKTEVDLMCRCLLSCRTLEEAIRCAIDFCAMLYPRAGALHLASDAPAATFRMDSLRQRHSSAACLVDLTGLLFYLQLFSWLIGQPLAPERVFLAHPVREDASPFLGLFGAPVIVGEPTYGFTFDAALLSRPIVRQPAELPPFLSDVPFRLTGTVPQALTTSQQVQGFLEAALAREFPLPTLSEIAMSLGMSEPTLRRRLTAQGTGYHVLREQCLRAFAERCLLATRWSMGRIAGHLGFSDEASFRRAFVRWTGQAPSRFRRGQ
ncbi:AraC family transcriptional regulator [Pandoraea terrae]|uniref:AraC family transcriptional regulator n=1 Tax=Pandoraea terrae TaxID=1537710 RepID=A0A5E4T1W6_9BURK|nr:AraC family transcriptional regulator [Pandoraea terrae]VVD81441.1 AraC family transcriptional regulator [Pandoraea terrae]